MCLHFYSFFSHLSLSRTSNSHVHICGLVDSKYADVFALCMGIHREGFNLTIQCDRALDGA